MSIVYDNHVYQAGEIYHGDSLVEQVTYGDEVQWPDPSGFETLISDLFTDPDGTTLAAHPTNNGRAYTRPTVGDQDPPGSENSLVIEGNQLVRLPGPTQGLGMAVVAPLRQEYQLLLDVTPDSGDDYPGLCLRVAADGSCLLLSFRTGAGLYFYVRERDATGLSTLVYRADRNNVPPDTYTLRVRDNGTRITVWMGQYLLFLLDNSYNQGETGYGPYLLAAGQVADNFFVQGTAT